MKKFACILALVIAASSMASCGASSTSCTDSEKYIIKNMKFENKEMVLSKKFKSIDESIQ
jgi:hypothetical protein